MTRFGMDVVLAHPEGYDIMPEVEEVAKKNAAENGGSFTKTNSMAEAFKDADIVYPKSWAPFAAMEKRTDLYAEVEASVFDRYRDPLYKEASYKPYIIAAMILLAKQKDITGTLEALADKATPRHFGE